MSKRTVSVRLDANDFYFILESIGQNVADEGERSHTEAATARKLEVARSRLKSLED